MNRTGIGRVLAVVALVFALTGCQAFAPELAGQVSRVVAHYCAKPPEARAVLREAVATMTAPNAVRVTCAADTPAEAPAEPPAG